MKKGEDPGKGVALGQPGSVRHPFQVRLEVLVDKTISKGRSSVTRKRFHRSSSEDIAESSAPQSARLRPASSGDYPSVTV